MNIVDKLKKYREEKGMSLSELSKLSGIPKSTLQRYETGTTKKIPMEAIASIEKALNLNEGFMMGWTNQTALPSNLGNLLPIELKKFRLLGNVACGEPIYANEKYETYIEANGNIQADFCLIAKGDSMINARIFDGDIVFIRHQPDVENGEIAAVLIGDEVTLKRVFKYPNRLELRPENPLHRVQNYEGIQLEQIKILGKAIAFQSTII